MASTDKETIADEISEHDPLNQVPPDFQKAIRHGKANLVYDADKIDI